MKKIISLVLTLTLLVSVFNCVSFTTNAATTGTYNGFTYSIENGEVTITDYTGSATTVTIPSKISDYPVTTIGNRAFIWCGLTSVTIPNSVTTIGEYAFCRCESLTSVTIPNSVTTIGNSAFSHCGSLTSVTIPNSVTTIGDYAFYECSGLTSVTIPNSVTTIGNSAFNSCSSLLKVTIPESVVSIGDSAFGNCSKLTNVKIPDSVKSIGDYAFRNCAFKSITIPKSVESIGEYAFRSSSLESIVVNAYNPYYSSQDGVLFDKNKTKIIYFPTAKSGEYIIPNSVTTIGNGAFSNCDSLTSITIPNSVKSIGKEAFYNCYNLNTVVVGNGVKSIGDYAFYDCGLQNITLGNSVESIGAYAFSCSSYYRGATLQSIDLPESVKSVGNFAFENCANLESVIIRNDDVELGDGVFYNCNSNLTVTCNENSNAQEYCEEWGIPYNFTMGEAPIVPETPDDSTQEQYIIGDVNLDGTVDIFDLIALAKMIVGA